MKVLEFAAEKSGNIIEKIKAVVEENYWDEKLSIKTIGEEKLFLTPDYIGRIFKKKTGISLKEYINMVRIEKAKVLISENKYKIYEIARMCGYDDNAKYFSCVFKKMTGIHPTDFK